MPRANYPEPFVPRAFACWINRATTSVKVVDRRTGERVAEQEPRWDVEGRANGIQWAKRFDRAGLAESWKEELERGHAASLPFDLRSKRFVAEPSSPLPPKPPPASVFEMTEAFFWAHPDWEPKTKILAAGSLNRARRFLLRPEARLDEGGLDAVDDYLDSASFSPPHCNLVLTPRQGDGLALLRQNSICAEDVTIADVESFVAQLSTNRRDPSRRVSPSTIVRYTQPLRACWSWAVSRQDLAVTANPWLAVEAPRKLRSRTGMGEGGRIAIAVDKDVVLDIPQAVALADLCGEGPWGGVVECYVLAMAMCGLRPSEGVGLLWEDVELPDDESAGWLTVRRSRRRISARWLDPDEDAEWGPLKDRDIAETRRVPVPSLLVRRLADHHRTFGIGPDGLVFHRGGRPFDLTMFARDVWRPATAEMFPARTDIPADDARQPKLSRLRRHDLRHAACSWWLRSGVDATVCQRWSGHKSLSVFLDVYQGVAPGREDEGVRRLEMTLAPS